jgi:hypothetical protein
MGSAMAQLRRGGALVTGRRCQRFHELHHTGVVLLGLHTGEIGAVSAWSTVVATVKGRAPTHGGLP